MRVSRTAMASVTALLAGALLIYIGVGIGYPVARLCAQREAPLFKGSSLTMPMESCFHFSDNPWDRNWKFELLLFSTLGALLGFACLFAAWSLAKRKPYSRMCWTVTASLAALYFVLFPQLPAKVTMASLFVVLAAVSYFLLPAGAALRGVGSSAGPDTQP